MLELADSPLQTAAVPALKRVPHHFRIKGWTCDATDVQRTVWSMFDQADIQEYMDKGYLLVPGVLDAGFVDLLRAALEEHRKRDFGVGRESVNPADSHFQGQYVQNLLLRDPAMSRLLQAEPIVDTIRSLLGPCVMLYGSSGLVSFPDATRTGTDWHADYLVTNTPAPPLETKIPRVACMVYLDDLDEELGPTYVVPGSHRMQQLPNWKPEVDPVSVPLTPKAGAVLFFDASLWHRGGTMKSKSRPRRALVFQFVAGGIRLMREAPPRPAQGSHALELLERAEAAGDRGMLELLSQVWYG